VLVPKVGDIEEVPYVDDLILTGRDLVEDEVEHINPFFFMKELIEQLKSGTVDKRH
jgi:hypothetical protein